MSNTILIKGTRRAKVFGLFFKQSLKYIENSIVVFIWFSELFEASEKGFVIMAVSVEST